jgi:hypothetical protein
MSWVWPYAVAEDIVSSRVFAGRNTQDMVLDFYLQQSRMDDEVDGSTAKADASA